MGGAVLHLPVLWSGPHTWDTVIRTMDDAGRAPDDAGEDYGLYPIYGRHILAGEHALLYAGRATEQTFAGRFRNHRSWLEDEERVRIYLGRLDLPERHAEADGWARWRRDVCLAENIMIDTYSPHYNSVSVAEPPVLGGVHSVVLMHYGERHRLDERDMAPADWQSRMPAYDPRVVRAGRAAPPALLPVRRTLARPAFAGKVSAGVLVGRKDGELLEHRGEGSLITIAPGRTGKGLQLVATMLTYPGPMLIGDFKDGENYHITATARRRLGHAVIAFDPFGIVGGTGTFNPLVLIDEDDPEAGDNADLLADMLVVMDSRDRDSAHFTEIARTVIGGVILHVATTRTGRERSLPTVRQLLAQPEDRIEELLQDMLRNPAAGGQVASAAATVLQAKEKGRGSIMTTVLRHTRFLEGPRMQRFFSQETGNVDFADLKRGDVTLYLVLPARHLGGKHKRWARLMITCAIHAMTTTPGRSFHPNVWPLDEFGNVGQMDPVADGITLIGGYGVRFWPVFQDHSQGEEIYGKRWKNFLAGAEVRQIFGVSDLDTARYWSEYMGEQTIEVESENRSRGRSSSGGLASGTLSTGTGRTTSERGRRLLTPDEVIRLPRTQQLLIVRDEPPILSEKLNYLTDPEFRDLASPNPMYARAGAQPPAGEASDSAPERSGKDTSRDAEVGNRLAAIRALAGAASVVTGRREA